MVGIATLGWVSAEVGWVSGSGWDSTLHWLHGWKVFTRYFFKIIRMMAKVQVIAQAKNPKKSQIDFKINEQIQKLFKQRFIMMIYIVCVLDQLNIFSRHNKSKLFFFKFISQLNLWDIKYGIIIIVWSRSNSFSSCSDDLWIFRLLNFHFLNDVLFVLDFNCIFDGNKYTYQSTNSYINTQKNYYMLTCCWGYVKYLIIFATMGF